MNTNQSSTPNEQPGAPRAEYVDSAAAARFLGVSVAWLSKTRLTGKDGPPFVKLSRQMIRYHMPTLIAWAASRTHQSTSEYDRAPENWKKRTAFAAPAAAPSKPNRAA